MVKFVMEQNVGDPEVTVENYPKFLEKFKPRILSLMLNYARRFNVDASEIEESFYNSLLSAITKWRYEKRKNITFAKFYWWHANQMIYNLAKYEAKERERRYRYYEHLQNIKQEYHDQEHMLADLVATESKQELIRTAETKSEEFREILAYIKSFLAENYSRAKVISYTVKALAEKHCTSTETIYKVLRRLQEFMMESCKESGENLVMPKKKVENTVTVLTCSMCHKTKKLSSKALHKLLAQYMGLEWKNPYCCKKCKTSGYRKVFRPFL